MIVQLMDILKLKDRKKVGQ